ncbi:hypothetical protein K474DRAFT_1613127 [Panus rudis PR-1116 ss-1]|nr:hypothetical protein K474DRAFT_1613127 [Panus rudis PR-1116 ss-1]
MFRNASPSVAAISRCARSSFVSTPAACSRTFATETSSTRVRNHATPPALDRERREHSYGNPSSSSRPTNRTGNPHANVDGDRPKRLLRPYDLAQRLTKLVEEGQLQEAVDSLKTAPLDAQNVPLWNTMLNHCCNAGKYELAWKLFIDMKRRGFVPDGRTYMTMLSGLSQIKDWKMYSKQLDHAHSLYEKGLAYLEKLKELEPNSKFMNNHFINAYLKILVNAGLYDKVFDVYMAMDTEGPLAPDQFTYSILFHALVQRSTTAPKSDVSEAMLKSASDARLLWRQMTKSLSKRPNVAIDPYVVSSAIRALTRGSPFDSHLAFDILREYAGLTKPGEPRVEPLVKMNHFILQAALELCNVTGKHRLAVHWLQLALKMIPSEIDRRHLNQVHAAHVNLGNAGVLDGESSSFKLLQWQLERAVVHQQEQLRPDSSTYFYVMLDCWRIGDWASAARTFEMMTGYKMEQFNDGMEGPPTRVKRSKGLDIRPNTQIMSCFARASFAPNDPSIFRQVLRIISFYGDDYFLSDTRPYNGMARDKSIGFSVQKYEQYYQFTLANAIISMLSTVLPKGVPKPEGVAEGEMRAWTELGRKARALLDRDPKAVATAKAPSLESSRLGDALNVQRTDDQVDLDMTRRIAKISPRTT